MSTTQITTGKVRLSYVHVASPYASNGDEPKYQVTALIPKTDKPTMAKIKAATEAAKANFTAKGGKLPASLKTILHDGDGEKPNGGEYGPECQGCWVMTVSSKTKPVLVDAQKNMITDPNEIYSGCYGRIIVNFYVYENSGSKGLSAGLNAVMKLYDGEPLGGAIVTDSDWDDGWEDDDDLLG